MIQIERLTKKFGRTTVLDELGLRVQRGESVALWGRNGAGKTTILRCIAGLYRYRGRITIDGLDARRRGKHARRRIGYVPQEAGLYDDLRAAEALRFFARLRGVREVDPGESLRQVGLSGHGHKRVRELSGGMKQRLSLAVALLGDPPVLLLDEVTASLDALGRHELIGLLSGLTRSSDRAVLFASHRVEEIAALAQRVLVLESGRVAEDLPTERFVERFAESSVLHLLLEGTSLGRAMQVLTQRGYEPTPNGRGLYVTVPHGRRMEPIRALHEASVRVDDFEVLTTEQFRSKP